MKKAVKLFFGIARQALMILIRAFQKIRNVIIGIITIILCIYMLIVPEEGLSLMVIFCIVFVRSTTVVVYVYCFGMLYGAIVRIISAFRKTAVVYIQ